MIALNDLHPGPHEIMMLGSWIFPDDSEEPETEKLYVQIVRYVRRDCVTVLDSATPYDDVVLRLTGGHLFKSTTVVPKLSYLEPHLIHGLAKQITPVTLISIRVHP